MSDSGQLTFVAPTPFMPVVCSKQGALAFGAACASLMPSRALVHVVGGAKMTLMQGGGLPLDETDLKAPEAPACCMYNGCRGVTVPFTSAGAPWIAKKITVAVWPAEANVELVVPGAKEAFSAPELGAAATAMSVPMGSAVGVTVRGRRYATAKKGGGAVVRFDKGRWTPALKELLQFGRSASIVAVTDVNRDGHNEIMVYGPFANDYAFAALSDDKDAPGWSFSCGNI